MKGGGEGTLETANAYWWRGRESESESGSEGGGRKKKEINKPDVSLPVESSNCHLASFNNS